VVQPRAVGEGNTIAEFILLLYLNFYFYFYSFYSLFFILYFSDSGSKLKRLTPVGDYQLRSRKITPNTRRSSPVSHELPTSTPTINNQLGVRNIIDHTDNSEDPPLDGAGDERFMPRTLLDYATPRATDARDPIRLPRLTGEPPSYDMSTINILQNNCYHGLEHEDPHDHI
jgi:hypothetical protein